MLAGRHPMEAQRRGEGKVGHLLPRRNFASMLPMLAASHPALIREHKLLLFQILHFYQLFVSLCSGRDVGKETVNMKSTEVR